MNGVAKVFVSAGPFYVMSRKRAPGKKKDNKLELIGGNMELGETSLQALIREAEEEETSGLLASVLKRIHPKSQRIEVGGRGGEEHYIFRITVPEIEARRFSANSVESYGLQFVPAEAIDTDKGLQQLRDSLTPKTLVILRALGRQI